MLFPVYSMHRGWAMWILWGQNLGYFRRITDYHPTKEAATAAERGLY